jgi:DNA-binding GntR family transcriptional regulator
MELFINEQDMAGYGKANREFHMKLYAYSPNKLLLELIDDLWNKAELNRSRSVFLIVPNMADHSQQDHAELLDLIEEGKTEETLSLLKEHRQYSFRKLLGYADEK